MLQGGSAAILDYKAKYLRGSEGMETTPREVPANIPEPIAVRIRSMAVAIVEAFACVPFALLATMSLPQPSSACLIGVVVRGDTVKVLE